MRRHEGGSCTLSAPESLGRVVDLGDVARHGVLDPRRARWAHPGLPFVTCNFRSDTLVSFLCVPNS
jgi:hypothetical protein